MQKSFLKWNSAQQNGSFEHKRLYLSTYLICVIGLDLMVMMGLLCLSLGNQVKVFGWIRSQLEKVQTLLKSKGEAVKGHIRKFLFKTKQKHLSGLECNFSFHLFLIGLTILLHSHLLTFQLISQKFETQFKFSGFL